MSFEPHEVDLDKLNAMQAAELLEYAFRQGQGGAAIGTSLQKSGVVLIDLASRLGVPYRVFYIDTQLDYPETYELFDRVQKRYGIEIERYLPDPAETEALRRQLGQWEHYFDRRACCDVRKVRPLKRAQQTLDVWLAGLRSDQSGWRSNTAEKATWVSGPGGRRILKLNPLYDWTVEQVDAYIRDRDVPCNRLYDRVTAYGERFTVISCQRCHIPVKEHLDRRAGKWPWEAGVKKECGLHEHGGGI